MPVLLDEPAAPTPGEVTVESTDPTRIGEYRTPPSREIHILDRHYWPGEQDRGYISADLIRDSTLRAQARALTIQTGIQTVQFNGNIMYRASLPFLTGTTGNFRYPSPDCGLPGPMHNQDTNEWVVVVRPTGMTNQRGEPIFDVVTEYPPRPIGSITVPP